MGWRFPSGSGLAVFLFLIFAGCGKDQTKSPMTAPAAISSGRPSVTVTQPAAGETYFTALTITWTASDPDDGETDLLEVAFHYSGDGGDTWATIDSNETNDGSYLWDLAGVPDGIEYRVRVAATDPWGLSGADTTESSFFIINPVYITDQAGVDWEISHAIFFYNMRRQNWAGGLGGFAVPPIDAPGALVPGNPGYPASDSDQRVIGVIVDGDVRAYPIDPTLSSRHVVNDSISGRAVAVLYCPLRDEAAVGSRRLCACTPALTLANSGWTYELGLVLWDYETGSLWRPLAIDGSFMTGVSGVFADQSLEEFPSVITEWSSWVAYNPESKYMEY